MVSGSVLAREELAACPFAVGRFVVVSAAFHTLALAQQAVYVSPWQSVLQPPVPSDPLELAGNAQPVQDAVQRATAVALLQKARTLSNVRRWPYDLKTRFVSNGTTSSDGSWQLQDTSPGLGIYRWQATGPSYSAVNLYTNSLLYSNQPPSGIPLRLAQVRAAIFFNFPMDGPRAIIRTSAGSLNGMEVSCVLVSHVFNAKPAAGPRRWEEYESCVDPQSGLLMSYSPAPGLYVLYDYSNARRFHDKIIPGKFTITEAGQPVIEAQVESVSDAPEASAALFNPAGLNPLGVGSLMTPPWRFQNMFMQGKPASNQNAQFVVLHGMLSAEGRLLDPEVLASSSASLNQQALERVTHRQNWRPLDGEQPGTTPQSHEVFFTSLFLNQ